MTDDTASNARTCEWCGSPMTHDGRAVCPSCGRLASRLAAMEETEGTSADDVATPADAPPPPPTPPPPPPAAPAAPEVPQAAPPKPAAPKPAPPKPAPPKPAPPKPAPPRAAPAPRTPAASKPAASTPAPDRDAPLPPGIAWPAPAPIPPDEEGRTWWKIIVPVAAVVVLLVIGLVVVLGGGGGSDDAAPDKTATVDKKADDSVDISDLDDPATTTKATTTTEVVTTTAATTTTVPGSDRVEVISGLGVEWTMAAKPDNAGVSNSDGTRQLWTAQADKVTTESVEITDLQGSQFDLDAELNAVAAKYSGKLSKIEDSHLAQVSGRTASFTSDRNGDPTVGYAVAVQSGDQGIVVVTLRKSDDLDGLYLDWLKLPGSFTITT